jgi:hypothetical protein
MRSPRRFVLPLVTTALVVGACSEHEWDVPAESEPTGATGEHSEAPAGAIEVSVRGPAWSLPTPRLVSAPAVAGGRIVAYAAAAGRLSLIVVDPETGEVVDRRPSASSYATPGVSMEIATRGDLVFHYRPTGRPQQARLEVYDVRRDQVVGRSAPTYFWSLPTGCVRPDAGPICVAAGDANPASVYRVEPATADLRLAVSDAGRSLGAGLYDASDTISRLRADRRVWRRTAPAMFGGRPVSPTEGWDWQRQGAYLIGSFGVEERRVDGTRVEPPGHIARIDPRTGRTMWVRPGTTYCDLDLIDRRPPTAADGGSDV